MKKFGTPIGAAPGSACEKVGLAGVGTPSPWRIAVASGLPSARFLRAWASSPVALRSSLPTVFWPCWPPAETNGVLSARPGTASVAVPGGVLALGAPSAGAPAPGSAAAAGGASAGGGVEPVPVSAGAGASVGDELVPVPVDTGGAGASVVTLVTGVEAPGSA